MKKTTIYIALMIVLTQLTSCEFINGLISETKKADTRVDHMTSNFTITDDIIYINLCKNDLIYLQETFSRTIPSSPPARYTAIYDGVTSFV